MSSSEKAGEPAFFSHSPPPQSLALSLRGSTETEYSRTGDTNSIYISASPTLPPCGDEVDSGISGQNTQTEEEAGGASRFSRHAELRGDETGAAAVLLVTSSEEVLGIFSQQLQIGGEGRRFGRSRQPFKVAGLDSCVELLSSGGRHMQRYSKRIKRFGDASLHFSSIRDHLQ